MPGPSAPQLGLVLAFALTLAVALASSAPVPAATLTPVEDFGSNPGNLQMYLHRPPGVPAGAPLVVLLHGCTQQAPDLESVGWTALSDSWGFFLLYPQQLAANNPAGCFNFFEPGDQVREAGEPLSIAQMIDAATSAHSIDPKRVFVVGFSAGGAMAAVMAATYPERFAGAALVAGVPYRCATNAAEAFGCMKPGVDRSAREWGDLVRTARPGYSGSYPKISIWHGAADPVVLPSNQVELVEQWTNIHGLDSSGVTVDSKPGSTRRSYAGPDGEAVVETVELMGLGHAIAIDPDLEIAPGVPCGTVGRYFADADVCSAYAIGRFFGLEPTLELAPAEASAAGAPRAATSAR